MQRLSITLLGVGGSLLLAAAASGESTVSDGGHYAITLNETAAKVSAYDRSGRIKRLYGQAFSHGTSPEESAGAFLEANAALLGVERGDLAAVGPFFDGRHTQPIMYDLATGKYKFTGVYYAQHHDGIPVFRARMMVLVRNEPDHPAVLASTDLRNLGGFEVNRRLAAQADGAGGIRAAKRAVPGLANFTDPRAVIWAGVGDLPVEPRVAMEFVGDNGMPATADYRKWLFLTDAATGEILYRENMILNIDIVGNVSGKATEPMGADICGPEPVTPLPYARVAVVGSTSVYADENGDFVIPWDGSSPVDVESTLVGQWFEVNNQAGGDAYLKQEDVVPPGPVNFIHNEPNTDEWNRAEVNGYVQANVVRSHALKYNPDYPGLQEKQFPVNVNLNDTCNAFYDYSSINFFKSGGGCANTAFDTIIHHEYGHHLVQMAGSGQGAYGEGLADTQGVLIFDYPDLALGFWMDCDEYMRTADNDLQYPCDGEIHYCGQLISGCIWDTRNELKITNPDTYRDIIASLAINSMLLHTGSGIDPSITVDFLVLDDDNGDIYDGTPHYWEIAAGFGAHNMDAPELALLGFEFPDGLPELIDPDGGTAIRVVVGAIAGEPEPGTAVMYFDAGSGWDMIEMTEIEPNVYDAVFPAVQCATQVAYYFAAETTDGVEQLWPIGAPDVTYTAVAAYGSEVVFADDFESDNGWIVEDSPDLTEGSWDRGVPIDDDRGDPPTDADGSGQCYVTGNSDNEDIDDGTTILTSPVMDATGDGAVISYWRWYSNVEGSTPYTDTFYIRVSDDGGDTWSTLEKVGPSGPEVEGGWYHKEFAIADYVDPTDQFQIRFEAGDLGEGSIVEAAVDGVELTWYDCEPPTVPEDINGDGAVDVLDLLAVLAAWGPCPGCPEDINGDDVVDVLDLLAVLGAWTV